MQQCINCDQNEDEIPLVNIQYKGEKIFVCSGCMPVLLHSPAKMVGKLKDADKIQATKL